VRTAGVVEPINLTIRTKQDVVWGEVAVDYSMFMSVVKTIRTLHDAEFFWSRGRLLLDMLS